MPFQIYGCQVLTLRKYGVVRHRTRTHRTLKIKKSASAFLEIYFIMKIVLNYVY